MPFKNLRYIVLNFLNNYKLFMQFLTLFSRIFLKVFVNYLFSLAVFCHALFHVKVLTYLVKTIIIDDMAEYLSNG